jgi:hypothetical protein
MNKPFQIRIQNSGLTKQVNHPAINRSFNLFLEDPMSGTGPVYELRRYRLQANKREALIELFEREFVETQVEVGMTLHGFYRDVNDADAFVWMRSFSDMQKRADALAAFYGGDVWKRWGSDANATMLNSDNV